MEGASTASLRKMAPHWSLAGDKQLLDLLQNLHESIVSKCQAANTSLDEMVNALDTASISLQNVNNRFMALSNSQFVESRVYDDDVDIAAQEVPVKEPPKPVDPASELIKLKDSLRILESYHEEVHIMDSDSETSDEEEDRMVFKPKDQYADRPLPYIIGSRQWKSKWHAGLLPEESDTDSSTSKPGVPLNEYSDSEPEENDVNIDKPQVSQRTISTNSSIGSELTIPTVGKPADIAAELARRLGGNIPPPVPQPEPEFQAPASGVSTKTYRPQQPTTATIFSDEPPPLDNYESDHSYQSESEDDDIFAELHRKSARQTEPRASNSVVDELFGNVANVDRNRGRFRDEDVFSGVSQPVSSAQQSSPLFEDRQDSELFINKPREEPQPTYVEEQTHASVKKPIGGISLFGNNKGTESIGAAILKRNQRKASTSEDETENESSQTKSSSIKEKPKDTIDYIDPKDKTQKDIINDLFAKPNKKVEKVAAVKSEKSGSRIIESTTKKVDLFTDDLFDDIDDIFTSPTKAPAKQSKGTVPKSLFDDADEDDLFANVAVSSKKAELKPDKENKGIFDSDDDLFSENNEVSDINKAAYIDKTAKSPINSKLSYDRKDSVNKSSVDAGSKELLSDKKESVCNVVTKSVEVIKVADETENIQKIEVFNDDITRKTESFKAVQEESSFRNNQVKGIFDSDSDDDIFSDFRTKNRVSNNQKEANIENNEVEKKKSETTKIEDVDTLFLRKEIPTTDKNTSIGPQIINNEITSSKENKFLDVDEINDDSLFVHKGKMNENAKDFNVQSSNKDDGKNVAIGDVENDLFENEKTDEIFTESIEDTPKNKNNTIVYCEDELFSSKQNEETEREDEISSYLTRTHVPNTQFKSLSLFDDDDGDMDSLFSKSTKGDIFKEVSKEKDSTVAETLVDKDSDQDIFEVPKTKTSIDTDTIIASGDKSKNEVDKIEAKINIQTMNKPNIDITTNVNDISQNIDVSQSIERDINVPKNGSKYTDEINEKSETITTITEDLQQEANIKPESESTEDSELRIPGVDFEHDTNSILEESLLKQKTENITDYDNTTGFIDKEPLFSESKLSVTNEPDVFSDIFSDVPPEFERPKEPKKSKNVNALFDDDSDDEALFFKKNDVIIEEKPEINFGTQEDRLFHIFHDEPPAIDVDFTQKPKKITSTDVDNTGHIDSEKPFESIVSANNDSEQLNSKTIYTDKLKKESIINNDSEQKTTTPEIKKPIGKLKPMNLNINVNSLLPGASPKKTKSIEQIDGQTVSINSPDADNKDAEPKMIKSVSFEGDPDSGILDNKISKERAKIQVKRRPSTRRARKEAVRKSGIDFGEDSTDNSSSTDISKKDDLPIDKNDFTNIANNEKVKYAQEKYNTNVDKNVIKTHEDKSEHKEIQDERIIRTNQEIQSKNIETLDQSTKSIKEEDKKTIRDIENENKPSTVEASKENSSVSKYNTRSNVTSKVVYILNDEDIFSDTKPIANPTKSKILNIVDDDDAIFKSSSNNEPAIATPGNVYKDVKSNRKDLDNFDSDEDIFKASESKPTNKAEEKIKNKSEIDEMEANIDKLFVKTQNSKPKSSLFDLSDDENDLFSSKKSTGKSEVLTASTSDKVKEVKLPKVEVKGSLFGDDSDDDDLFGVKTTKKQEPSRLLSQPKEVISKASEPVFEDPLSLLSQDEDV